MKALLGVLLAAAFVVPLPALAQGAFGGIVPQECRSTGTSDALNTVNNCDLCALAQMAQNLANFLLGLTIPAAALLFAWAGILFFTSRGNLVQIVRAKKIFSTTVIGFVIALGAWSVVITVMNVLTQGSSVRSWNWSTLDCTQTRVQRQAQTQKTIGDYLNSSLPRVTEYVVIPPPAPTDPIYQVALCRTGAVYSASMGGCIDTATGECAYANCGAAPEAGVPVNRASAQCPSSGRYDETMGGCIDIQTGECSYSNCGVMLVAKGGKINNAQMAAEIDVACSQYSSVNCSFVKGIAGAESSGGADCSTSHTGAAGCMQVLATTACGINPNISSECGACLRSKNSTSVACAPVIDTISTSPQMGTSLGVQYISQLQSMSVLKPLQNQYGTCQITAAAYFQGPGNVLKAGGVPSNANSYVKKVCG